MNLNESRDRLSLTFAALGDPTRRAILARLAQGETSVSELSRPFLNSMSPPAITKHLKVLERAGLISRGREAQWRPCRIKGEALHEIHNWIEHYRVLWEASFDRLGAYLKTLPKDDAPASPRRKATPAQSQHHSKKGKPHVRKK